MHLYLMQKLVSISLDSWERILGERSCGRLSSRKVKGDNLHLMIYVPEIDNSREWVRRNVWDGNTNMCFPINRAQTQQYPGSIKTSLSSSTS